MLPPGPETGGIPDALPETSTAAAESKATPVPIDAGVAALSPENTKIVFVGTHIGARPDPRTGGFEKFSGKVEVDPSTKLLTSITVDIEAARSGFNSRIRPIT
jgi:polyisoprenoid-binding protein YceI